MGAAVVVLLLRPLAAWLSLLGTPVRGRKRALIAFFGIRGVGSFYYVAWGINHGTFEAAERLWAVTGLVVVMSIVVHGITSTPLMRWLDRKP
jgi:NhaP-type Na+/H+ or K+/H+ antiporter